MVGALAGRRRVLIFLTPRFQRDLFWHSSVYAKFDERLFGFSKVSPKVIRRAS